MSAARLCVLAFLTLAAFPAQALDTEVKVLVVMAPGAAVYDEQTITINRLEAAWSSAGNLTTPMTLSVVNEKNAFGNHIKPVLTGPAISGNSHITTYTQLLSGSYNLAALRDANAADLVVVIVPSGTMLGACGFAPQQYWTDWPPGSGFFVQEPSGPAAGLDLRGSICVAQWTPLSLSFRTARHASTRILHSVMT